MKWKRSDLPKRVDDRSADKWALSKVDFEECEGEKVTS